MTAPFFRGRVDLVVDHARFRALGEDAQALYLDLGARASAGGRLAFGLIANVVECHPRSDALEALVAADLLGLEPDGGGAWLRAPATLDLATDLFTPHSPAGH